MEGPEKWALTEEGCSTDLGQRPALLNNDSFITSRAAISITHPPLTGSDQTQTRQLTIRVHHSLANSGIISAKLLVLVSSTELFHLSFVNVVYQRFIR